MRNQPLWTQRGLASCAMVCASSGPRGRETVSECCSLRRFWSDSPTLIVRAAAAVTASPAIAAAAAASRSAPLPAVAAASAAPAGRPHISAASPFMWYEWCCARSCAQPSQQQRAQTARAEAAQKQQLAAAAAARQAQQAAMLHQQQQQQQQMLYTGASPVQQSRSQVLCLNAAGCCRCLAALFHHCVIPRDLLPRQQANGTFFDQAFWQQVRNAPLPDHAADASRSALL